MEPSTNLEIALSCRDDLVRLDGGDLLAVKVLRYPLSAADQAKVIELWRTEWEETGFEWLPWINGVYASALVTETAIAFHQDTAVATATVCWPRKDPEICVVMNVLTRKGFRGRGIANQLTDLVVNRGFRSGCTAAYLGNTPTKHSVYEDCDFVRIAGVFMRRTKPGAANLESSLFSGHQKTSVRAANWGDIPGVAALVAHPLETFLMDYPRGLVSSKYLAPERGLTQFSAVWYGSRRAGGDMHVLTGATAHRILGFGSFTPGLGAVKNFLAHVDFLCHDAYRDQAPLLLQSLIRAGKANTFLRELRLITAVSDEWKRQCASDCGFGEAMEIPEQLHFNTQEIALVAQKFRFDRSSAALTTTRRQQFSLA